MDPSWGTLVTDFKCGSKNHICEGSKPTTDHNSVGPLDVSSVFSVRRRIETHHGRRLSRSSPLSSVLSRLLRQKKDRNPPQSTTLSVLMASTPVYSRLLHQKKDLNPPQSTTLSVLIVSPASSLSIEQENPTVPPPPPPPPRETPTASHPPRETNLTDERKQSLINSLRPTYLTEQEMETRLQPLFNIMTSSEEEDVALFQEVISKLTGSELWWMAYLLNSNFDHYFLEIARNRIGSIRLRTLFGKSDDADSFFLGPILRHFFHVMTDKEASYAASFQPEE
ncbi:hypothetical protein F2Q69_00044204 [Brassica cretica]|uniref:Uncharacterized protein n=1 Tax=Brassica cretica TaxID=69181 RepID=A0A8S9ND11_BRACR|nr:hypothetical protein F2Q69_00044204 [Brassica cretica]